MKTPLFTVHRNGQEITVSADAEILGDLCHLLTALVDLAAWMRQKEESVEIAREVADPAVQAAMSERYAAECRAVWDDYQDALGRTNDRKAALKATAAQRQMSQFLVQCALTEARRLGACSARPDKTKLMRLSPTPSPPPRLLDDLNAPDKKPPGW